ASEFSVKGPATGYGIEYKMENTVTAGSSGVTATAKLDEKSLSKAALKTGLLVSPLLMANGARRPNYSILGMTLSKNRRRLLKLRDTFNKIAACKQKIAAVAYENLPEESKRRMIRNAINRGETNTKFGDMERSLKVAGMSPENLPSGHKARKKYSAKKKKKERQWALFVNPELIPSGWATD
ncbi:MAG: hypothetical protein FWF23_04980, partial [Alphaproteobacteria bacterium]|nr:hypothetical protein [Alphaproteobacteria bacterium]